MRVIDLLDKIANGEEVPKRIKYRDNIYEYEEGYDFISDNLEHPYFAENYCTDYEDLNSEVEILEEDKKIDKIAIGSLNKRDDLQRQIEVVHYENVMIANAVNEIIDKINRGE